MKELLPITVLERIKKDRQSLCDRVIPFLKNVTMSKREALTVVDLFAITFFSQEKSALAKARCSPVPETLKYQW